MRHWLLAVLAVCLGFAPCCAGAQGNGERAQGTAIAVIDFDYVDTSGEARDQRAEHEARLGAFMSGLKGDLGRAAKFRLVTPTCRPGPCSLADTTLGNLLAAAREAGADILLVGGVHKMSTLVQNAKIVEIDTRSERIVFERLFTFRGDTDEAWRRAEAFIFEEIAALESASPTKIAVFDFELDDSSAGGGIAGDAAADLTQLDRATSEARRTISGSGRYQLVDVSSAAGDDVKSRSLRHCNGCEAAIAQKLGADQSFVGVVTRISRTEYTVRFQIRDAHTGAIVIARQSDLRIGADYSWNRGAAALIRGSLLNDP
jgi:Protein of unknown function (DUF2380)